MHYFPSEEKFRAKWTCFVCIHRKDWFRRSPHVCVQCTSMRAVLLCKDKPIFVTTDSVQTIEIEKEFIKGSLPSQDTVVPVDTVVAFDWPKAKTSKCDSFIIFISLCYFSVFSVCCYYVSLSKQRNRDIARPSAQLSKPVAHNHTFSTASHTNRKKLTLLVYN